MRYVAVVTVALGCLVTAVGGAWSQAFKVGVVDIDEVGAKFERKQQEEKRLGEWYDQKKGLLDSLSTLPYLNVDEWGEAVAIYQTASRTQAQDDRAKALQAECTKREREVKDLEVKVAGKTASADENARYQTLQGFVPARGADLKQLAGSLDDELRQRQQQLGAALMEPVQAVIKQIATEKGYTLILTKAVVFLGGDDLTAEVIEKVNAAAKASEGKPAAGEAPKPAGGAGDKPATGGGGK